MLYRALVESRILYCISIWGGANQSYLGKIISLQKKASEHPLTAILSLYFVRLEPSNLQTFTNIASLR